jgi:DNA invertase Pin-like site-specific DNA recombinase
MIAPIHEPATIVYMRHSSDKQTNIRQEGTIDALLKRRPELVPIRHVITDDIQSGKKELRARPGGKQLLSLLRPGDQLIIDRVDRLARNFFDGFEQVKKLCNDKGVTIWLAASPGGIEKLDLSNAMGRFMFAIMQCMADMQREYISETTKEALAARRARGLPHNHPSYGYEHIGEKGKRQTVPVAHEQAVLEQIVDLYRQGFGGYVIANVLNAAANAVDECDRWKLLPRSGKPWKWYHIHRLLDQVQSLGVYAGLLQKMPIEGNHALRLEKARLRREGKA